METPLYPDRQRTQVMAALRKTATNIAHLDGQNGITAAQRAAPWHPTAITAACRPTTAQVSVATQDFDATPTTDRMRNRGLPEARFGGYAFEPPGGPSRGR